MPSRRHNQRGLTLLEAVFAVALLGVVAASMFGTIDFLLSRQTVQERRLAAMELANRLMLQHLDDPTELEDDQGLPIRYHQGPGADLFRWEMDKSAVDIELDSEVAQRNDDDETVFADYTINHVTVRVWLAEQSGGAYRPERSPVVVELSRLVDPTALRTPEQVLKIFNDPERLQEMIENVGGRR